MIIGLALGVDQRRAEGQFFCIPSVGAINTLYRAGVERWNLHPFLLPCLNDFHVSPLLSARSESCDHVQRLSSASRLIRLLEDFDHVARVLWRDDGFAMLPDAVHQV